MRDPWGRTRLLLISPHAPFRSLDDDWIPACRDHDSALWTDPQSRQQVSAAATFCKTECDRATECLAGAKERGEWGVWGGLLLQAGRPMRNYSPKFWREEGPAEATVTALRADPATAEEDTADALGETPDWPVSEPLPA